MGFLSFSLWMLAVAVAVAVDAAAQPTTKASDVVAIKKIIDHFGLSSKLNFSGVDPCTPNATWAPESANPRVDCDCSGNECRITHLKIYALDVSGKIPEELFLLTQLMDLNLAQNVLSGHIPSAIGKLSNMQYLTFGINNLTGPLPVELGNLTKLRTLGLGSNRFNGTMPSELGNLISLEELYIDSSGVTGSIPQSLSKLRKLKILWASDNAFTGKIPEFLGDLTGFIDMRLEGTNLEGPIPTKFGALTKLQDLRIGDLIGASTKSLDFLENLTQLFTLSLRNCQIGGKIPDFSSFPNMTILDLSFNKLIGEIPSSFKNTTSLQYLFLGSNNLTGSLDTDILRNLIALDVSFNPLTGSLPLDRKSVSINVVGTSIKDTNLNQTAVGMLQCLQGGTKCTRSYSSSFAVSCGGNTQKTIKNITFDSDLETLGAASLYASTGSQWAVSNNGLFISNINGSLDKVQTDSQITYTPDSELYKTARISANSLRYYGLGLENGMYSVSLHFAEIQMEDDSSISWRGLGRRVFDIHIQGARVIQDFNILNEAGGSKKALIRNFKANVTNTVMDIHLLWAGKGTCCIPAQSIFGPLISAVYVNRTS